ncbi:DUF2848 domain-containing protein [Roseococcus sp. YIM B11640]|uniref:DUF2848 domain-containing protein n=1 Tax=Roseococcus sp. YIM B11640 TaxID=3133973 RepID=UPI003C7EA56F
MRELPFAVADTTLRVAIQNLVIAGWTGRDAHKVQEHIEELAALGVAPPATTPCFYRAGIETLTQSANIDVLGGDSSGEGEWFILEAHEGRFIGCGSDHTDRKVEAYSITVSKQMCPKPIGTQLWPWAEVADHWDQLAIRTEIFEGGAWVPYQDGSVAAMRHPEELLQKARELNVPTSVGTLMFGGTLPVLGGIRPAAQFRVALHDPVLGRSLTHGYTSRTV